MANEGSTAAQQPFWRSLFSAGFYKRSQGKIARQVTFYVLLLAIVLGAWSLFQTLDNPKAGYPIAAAVAAVGAWLSFRLINVPKFADFLIAVEAEMNKVSWPSRGELWRSSVVVIVTILGLVAVLYLFDIVWQILLTWIGVLG